MSRFGELMTLFLQETAETERKNNRSTIVDFLTVRTMDDGGGGGGRSLRRRKSLHERLGLKSIVCCGSAWGFGASAMDAEPDEEDENDVVVYSVRQQIDVQNDNDDVADDNDDPECTLPSPRMNLADALAAERQFRSTGGTGDDTQPPLSTTEEVGTPLRISLMRLLEETDGQDEDDEKQELGRAEMCCVCMGRKKGAALIPCGHTYCRVCCRELWLNRGACPLCNRSILEILDIY